MNNSVKRVVVGADHPGFETKEKIKKLIQDMGMICEDVGTDSEKSVDYPLFAFRTAEKILENNETLGILICGTGIGMAISANKVAGIRAAVCHSELTAKMAREHNGANIMALGARIIDWETIQSMVRAFLLTPISQDERHARRRALIDNKK